MKGKPVLLLFFLLSVTSILWSQAPVRTEEFIYTILAFNGKDYSGTYCRQDSDTIYLYENTDSFISAGKAFVYYWPITESWKVDQSVLDVSFNGTLRVKDKDQHIELSSASYTYFSIREGFQTEWKAVMEDDAIREYDRYMELASTYLQEVRNYDFAIFQYEEHANLLFRDITDQKNAGLPYEDLLVELESLEKPEEPEVPSYYGTPPVPLKRGYHLNLPKGKYTLSFLTREGLEMAWSEKTLIVEGKQTGATIGFEVIPADRWVYSSDSVQPSSVLYVNGKTDLYLRPFFQEKYNDLFYSKLIKNDAVGNRNVDRWVKIRQVFGSSIVIEYENESVTVKENQYVVEQTKSASLGYTILPYNPDEPHDNRAPNLIAYRIPIDAETPAFSFYSVSEEGSMLSGSGRKIRVVEDPERGWLFIATACIPLIIMIIVQIRRKKKLLSEQTLE